MIPAVVELVILGLLFSERGKGQSPEYSALLRLIVELVGVKILS